MPILGSSMSFVKTGGAREGIPVLLPDAGVIDRLSSVFGGGWPVLCLNSCVI